MKSPGAAAPACFAAVLFTSACGVGAAPASTKGLPQALEADFARADATHQAVNDMLDLGAGVVVCARLETTQQGNGTLTVGNLSLRLKDLHDDGLVYAGNGVLKLDVIPLFPHRQPGALVISGIALHTGDKERGEETPEAVVFIYRLDCSTGRFVRLWRNTGTVEIELDANAGGVVHCGRS